jgi:hypothetical protein
MPTFPNARLRLRAFIVLGLAAAIGACEDLTTIDASYQNLTAQDTAYAVNGAPPRAPNTLKFFDGVVAHADQGFGFDIAFDLDQAGNIIIIPSRALASSFTSPYTVALQRVTGPFELVLEAPEDGYRPDTAMTISLGQTIVAESRDPNLCGFALKGQSYYSKLVINEVDLGLRRIIFTVTVNRNCGFHSFAPGIPRD